MVAALSPASVNLNETYAVSFCTPFVAALIELVCRMSTLRFAQRAKTIVNAAKQNVSAKDQIIAELTAVGRTHRARIALHRRLLAYLRKSSA